MHDLRIGFYLHGLNPAILGEPHLAELVDPPVGTVGVHDEILVGGDQQVGRAAEPLFVGSERERGRQIGRIALRRAAVHPSAK